MAFTCRPNIPVKVSWAGVEASRGIWGALRAALAARGLGIDWGDGCDGECAG